MPFQAWIKLSKNLARCGATSLTSTALRSNGRRSAASSRSGATGILIRYLVSLLCACSLLLGDAQLREDLILPGGHRLIARVRLVVVANEVQHAMRQEVCAFPAEAVPRL